MYNLFFVKHLWRTTIDKFQICKILPKKIELASGSALQPKTTKNRSVVEQQIGCITCHSEGEHTPQRNYGVSQLKKLLQGLSFGWVIQGGSVKAGFALDWMLSEIRSSSMIRYLNKSHLQGGQPALRRKLLSSDSGSHSFQPREEDVLCFVDATVTLFLSV